MRAIFVCDDCRKRYGPTDPNPAVCQVCGVDLATTTYLTLPVCAYCDAMIAQVTP